MEPKAIGISGALGFGELARRFIPFQPVPSYAIEPFVCVREFLPCMRELHTVQPTSQAAIMVKPILRPQSAFEVVANF